MPVAVGLLLTWVLVADPLVLVVGIIPLVAVCAMRVARELSLAQRREGREPGWARASLRARWYELALAVAAILAEGLASVVSRLLRASGGFFLHPVPYQLAPVHTWPKHAWVTGEGLLALFGAKPQGPAAALAFALLHLAGVALVAWAMVRVARHFFSWPDMISQILLVAMVINVVAYVPSTLADATDLNAREFAVVLPFGAVLAGRTLAPALRDGLRRWRRPVPAALLAGALLAGYGASLGYAAAQPSVPPANAQLAAFLAAHHLTSGIGGYWESSVVTVGSDGAVTIRAVLPGTLQPDLWEAKGSWYDSGAKPRDVPRHRQRAWILQPLAAQPGRAGRPGPAGQDLSRRSLHRVRLEQEPAGWSRAPVTSRRPRVLISARNTFGSPPAAVICGPEPAGNTSGCCCQGATGRSLGVWTGEYSESRTSTALPAPSAGSGGSRPTRWRATCSGAWCHGAVAATSSSGTGRGSTSTWAATRSTPRPNATTCSTSWPTTRRGSGSWKGCSSTPTGGCARRASPGTSTCSRTTPTPRATPTAATRTTWSAGTASSAGWPTS